MWLRGAAVVAVVADYMLPGGGTDGSACFKLARQ